MVAYEKDMHHVWLLQTIFFVSEMFMILTFFSLCVSEEKYRMQKDIWNMCRQVKNKIENYTLKRDENFLVKELLFTFQILLSLFLWAKIQVIFAAGLSEPSQIFSSWIKEEVSNRGEHVLKFPSLLQSSLYPKTP